MSRSRLHTGRAQDVLRRFGDGTFRCCITSPPYWGLRDYGVDGQLGLERTPEEYVARLVDALREVRRVLTADGTLWLNLGDSYAGSGKGGNPEAGKQATNRGSQSVGVLYQTGQTAREAAVTNVSRLTFPESGIKAKDLVGIPWMVAFALRSDGWFLRSDIIWSKPNPMPESVRDRPTRAHEYLFLLSKSARYFYDAAAVAEPAVTKDRRKWHDNGSDKQRGHSRRHAGFNGRYAAAIEEHGSPSTRNRRSVWEIAPKSFRGAHFATFPEQLVEPCLLAGSAEGDTVLDPFSGSGTVGVVAYRHDRSYVGIDINPEYTELAAERIRTARENARKPPRS